MEITVALDAIATYEVTVEQSDENPFRGAYIKSVDSRRWASDHRSSVDGLRRAVTELSETHEQRATFCSADPFVSTAIRNCAKYASVRNLSLFPAMKKEKLSLSRTRDAIIKLQQQ